ncbi:bromodomain containing protein, putative [Entamoeba invadens IP1]|uniref:Bromodomain containing protein, putative n=1 Tax=Entamoeba invadens IP1 TaxID=370355 RepID=A0A0A1UDH4_ENTIV|nr:bromodomain containing protein, putative [Entamoeba invadens IP1]ELP94596.1 bromodomain containing protein, putative [Entamoeba invadens IP1]|eukprot:XP_004261367.1 bromodomain containing protein, putative [Entamoeba invadens IP1]
MENAKGGIQSIENAVRQSRRRVTRSMTPAEVVEEPLPTQPKPEVLSHKDKERCQRLINDLEKTEGCEVFMEPVDPIQWNIPQYSEIIKTPMDIGTVKVKLHKNFYPSREDFVADVRLTFQNAMTFNPPDNPIHKNAKFLLAMFENHSRHEFRDKVKKTKLMKEDDEDDDEEDEIKIEDEDGDGEDEIVSKKPRKARKDGKSPKEIKEVKIELIEKDFKEKAEKKRETRALSRIDKKYLAEKLQDVPHDVLNDVVDILKLEKENISNNTITINFDNYKYKDLKAVVALFRQLDTQKQELSDSIKSSEE